MNGERQRVNVGALALGPVPSDEIERLDNLCASFGRLCADRMQACSCGMREGEIRVGGDRLVQCFPGTWPQRQQEIDTGSVSLCSEVGSR
ncbi:hypothetical protein OKW31_006762 [Paraburkholderia atlantica]